MNIRHGWLGWWWCGWYCLCCLLLAGLFWIWCLESWFFGRRDLPLVWQWRRCLWTASKVHTQSLIWDTQTLCPNILPHKFRCEKFLGWPRYVQMWTVDCGLDMWVSDQHVHTNYLRRHLEQMEKKKRNKKGKKKNKKKNKKRERERNSEKDKL